MKNLLPLLAFMFFALLATPNALAQKFPDLDKSPMDAAAYPPDYRNSDKLIKVIYSRPQLNERKVENLAPHGKVWRTGANEAPELTLYTDMKLGDETLREGTYSLFTIPGEEVWTIIVNADLNTWGSYFYEEERDIVRITVPVVEAGESLEAFSIMFEESEQGVDMHLGWGHHRVMVPFQKI